MHHSNINIPQTSAFLRPHRFMAILHKQINIFNVIIIITTTTVVVVINITAVVIVIYAVRVIENIDHMLIHLSLFWV